MIQANQAPTTSCAKALYFPLVRHRTGEDYFPESTPADLSRDATVNSIASGVWARPMRVLMLDLSTGISQDVSSEVARDVLAQCLSIYGAVPENGVRWFLEEHLGMNAVRSAELVAA